MSILLCISIVMTIFALGVLSLIWMLEYGTVRGWSPLHMIGGDAAITVICAGLAIYFYTG